MDKEYKVYNPFQKHNGKLYEKGATFTKRTDDLLYDENGIFMCHAHSEKSRQCLVGNDDGDWRHRGEVVFGIKHWFDAKDHDDFENRIEPVLIKMWDDDRFMRFNQNADDRSAAWIWNDDFYCAPVDELNELRSQMFRWQVTMGC